MHQLRDCCSTQATKSVEKPKKKQQVLKPRAAPIDLPTVDSELTTAEKAAVLRSMACLGYPDYLKGRGANFLKKGSSASTNKFYKKNGYWKIAVFGHHGSSSEAIFKFFKEVKRA